MIEMVPKTATAGRKYLFINGESGLNQFLNYVTGYLVFREVGTANYGFIARGGAAMDTTKKYIVTLTYNGDKMSATPLRLYYNGVEVISTLEKTVTEVMEFANTGTAMSIGNVVSGLEFQFTRATAWDVELSPAEIASCNFDCNETNKVIDILATEGNGATVYNLLETGNNGTITNATLSSVWGTQSDTLTAWNQLRGYSLYYNDSGLEYLRIPYKNDKTPLVITPPSGFVKVGDYPAGDFWNDSEALFKFDDTTVGSDLYNADVDRLFFDVTGVAQWFSLSDVYAKNRGYWYLSTFVRYQKTLFTLYKTYKTGPTDLNAIKAHKMRNAILYSGKEIQYDEITGQVLLSW